jgi:hypothetical protein
MLKVINKHLTELSDNDLFQSLIYLLKQQASNHSYTYNEVEVTYFFDYVIKNTLSKDKHKIKASKIINFIHYYKNELYGLKKFPLFNLFIYLVYKHNLNIDYQLHSLSDCQSGSILLKLFSSTLSLSEFKKFILRSFKNNNDLSHYLNEDRIELLVNAYQHNVKLSIQYFKWLFANQNQLNINLFNQNKGFDIWSCFIGETHYNSLIRWVINKISLEQLYQGFTFWGAIDETMVYFGDFLLLNGNKNNITYFIKKFHNHLHSIFIFSPTNSLCANESLTVKQIFSLYQSLYPYKTNCLFMDKNDLFSFVEAQSNVYVGNEHKKFIDQLIKDGNQIFKQDILKRDSFSISLTSKKSLVRVGLFELLWPHIKNEETSINYKNQRGHNILHLVLTLILDGNQERISLYNNSGKTPIDETSMFKFYSYEQYFNTQIQFLKNENFDFNSLSQKKNNALHFAFLFKHQEHVILKLVESGVSLIQKNTYGFDAFYYLIKNKAFYKKDFINLITTFYEKERIENLNKCSIVKHKKLKL